MSYENYNGQYVTLFHETGEVRIQGKYSVLFPSLPEARAIHAELTELFAILDEK